MSEIAALQNVPDVSFIDGMTLAEVQEKLRTDTISYYKQLTGKTLGIAEADELNLLILSNSLTHYQVLQCIDRKGKQELLKYSYGDYLDNMAARYGITRNPAQPATVIMRFALAAPVQTTVGIPAGTRVCTADNICFYTREYAEIPICGFATTKLRFTAAEPREAPIQIPIGTSVATAAGVAFRTDELAEIPACACATTTLLFTLKAPQGADTIIPAGTRVLNAAGMAFTTDGEGVVEASTPATVTVRFTARDAATYDARTTDTIIPAGTILTTAAGLRFATDELLVMDDTTGDVGATAVTPGAGSNGLGYGAICNIQNSTVAALFTVANISTSEGGESITSAEIPATAEIVGAAANGIAAGALNCIENPAVAAMFTAQNETATAGGYGSMSVEVPATAKDAGGAANGLAAGAVNVLADTLDGVSSAVNTTATAGGYGTSHVDITAMAVVAGTAANGVPLGGINILIDAIAYIGTVENISKPSGGADVENDDELTERVFLAPAQYSAAGPVQAYEYWAKKWRTDIADVVPTSPSDCVVRVYFMLDGGVAPSAADCDGMAAFLSDETIRPLTDKVEAAAPDEVPYNIELTYYINNSDASRATIIQDAVADAVEEYKTWQRKIGRDINPTQLIAMILNAGAKRVVMAQPAFAVVGATGIAKLTGQAITYGGMEYD